MRVLFISIPFYLFALSVTAIFEVITYLPKAIICLLFARYPKLAFNKSKFSLGMIETEFVRFKRWPAVKGVRIYPISILLALLLLVAFVQIPLKVYIAAIVFVVVVFVCLFMFLEIPETRQFKLFKAYLAAKKQKICPLITFED